MQIGAWGGHVFEVSPGIVRSFVDLTLRGSAEVEDKVASNQKYAQRKSGNAREISLTVILSAYMGCDVRSEVSSFIEDATTGESDYFYVGGKKLINEQLMLIEASANDVEIGPGGDWVYAKVQLTMRQSEKGEVPDDTGTSSAGGKTSGSKKNTGNTGNTGGTDKAKQLADTAAGAVLKSVDAIREKARQASLKKSQATGQAIAGKKQIQVIAKE